MKTSVIAFLAALLLVGVAQAASLKVSCAGGSQEIDMCRTAVEEWSRRSGHTATVVVGPANASERLRQYQQSLEQKSDALDVLQIDAPWTGMLQQHLIDLKPFSGGIEEKHLGGAVANKPSATG